MTEVKYQDLKDYVGKKITIEFNNKVDSFTLQDFKEDKMCVKKGTYHVWYSQSENPIVKYFINV